MATISTNFSNSRIDMSDPAQFVFKGGLSATGTKFSWLAGSSLGNGVFIHGSGLAYSGTGDSTELAGGTISRISLDVGNNNGSDTDGDLIITDTGALNAGAIRKGDARLFWNEILKGNDTINLEGLDESDIGHKANLIFGDDFSCPNFSTLNTETGADDFIVGADNDFILIGDVNEVRSGRTDRSGPVDITAHYTGGNDTIVSGVTDRFVQIAGDAQQVFEKGVVTGGNDTLNLSGSSYFLSLVAGDAVRLNSLGSVTGGADTIAAGASGTAAGDVYYLQGSGCFVKGGNDDISGQAAMFCAGDVLTATIGTSGNAVIGGNDRITGSGEADVIAGDVSSWLSQSSTLAGGRDIIDGGGGDDEIYGEVNEGALSGVTGGADRLSGGDGADQLSGQTGGDVLRGGSGGDVLSGGQGRDLLRGDGGRDQIDGGVGDDRLGGGSGGDRFIFAPGSGADRILDFADDGSKADDVIDVSAYNFASIGAIGKSASGDDLILNLGGGNTITAVGYLADHAANNINDDIVI